MELDERHTKAASIIARQFAIKTNDKALSFDDFYQLALIGIWRKGNLEENLNYHIITAKNYIIDYLRIAHGRGDRKKSHYNTVELSEDFPQDSYVPKTFEDEEVFESLKKKLNPRYYFILRCYLDGLTLKEIGNSLGVSESRASQLYKETRELSRVILES